MIFFNLESWEILQDNKNLAFSVDTIGRNFFTIFIKDLESKKIYPTHLKKVTSNFVWAGDNKTIFITQQDPETLRWNKVFKYFIETKVKTLVLEEMMKNLIYGLENLKLGSLYFLSGATLIIKHLINSAFNATPKLFLKKKRIISILFDGGAPFSLRQIKNLKI